MKPQDVVVLFGIVAMGDRPWTAKELATKLVISASEVGYSLRRCQESGLLSDTRKVMRAAFLEFVKHGLRYVFPARPGADARGVPTAFSAPPLNGLIMSDQAVVWPDPMGQVRGASVVPLYPTIVRAAKNDEQLYRALALVDAVRIGRARERELAVKELESILA